MSSIEDIKNALADKNISLSEDELAKITSTQQTTESRGTKPFIETAYVGYPDIQTKKRVYYMASIADPQPEKKRPLYLSIYFGNVFTTDIAKALAGRNTLLPYLVIGPFTRDELNDSVPIVGFEFDAPVIPFNNNLITYTKDGKAQPGKHQMNVTGTAVLWSADCDTKRYGSSSPADEKATIYDRRLFSTKIVSDD